MNQQVQINTVIGIMLFLCSIWDIKKKEIPSITLIAGAISLFVVLIIGKNIFTWSRFGGAMIGIIMIGISKVSRGQVGMGDGILLIITGIGMGVWLNISILAYGLFFACVFSFLFLLRHKISKKDTIPFVPFLFLGYISVLAIT